jgi:RimJ/RimL family protein N-acetyltransferase
MMQQRMVKMGFYQAGVHPPEELLTVDFLLRPLRSTDVELDYDAVMENPATLRLSGGGIWPADDFGLEGNLADLIVHEKEHEEGVAFTYTVLNPGQSQCLGCVYVNQLSKMHALSKSDEALPDVCEERDAIVRYWVRPSRIGDDLDWRLVTVLVDWFNDAWPLNSVYFRAHAHDRRQQHLMDKAGLPLAFTLDVSGRQGPFFAFGPVGAPRGEGQP